MATEVQMQWLIAGHLQSRDREGTGCEITYYIIRLTSNNLLPFGRVNFLKSDKLATQDYQMGNNCSNTRNFRHVFTFKPQRSQTSTLVSHTL